MRKPLPNADLCERCRLKIGLDQGVSRRTIVSAVARKLGYGKMSNATNLNRMMLEFIQMKDADHGR